MTILSSQVIKDFLAAHAEGKIISNFAAIDHELLKTTLIRFQTKDAFVDACDEYLDTKVFGDFSDFYLFGTFGGMFLEQNKDAIIDFVDSIKESGECHSVLEYLIGDVQLNISNDHIINYDDLARALYNPARTNPVELDPTDKLDATYITVARLLTGMCIRWTFHSFGAFIKARDAAAENQRAVKSFLA